MKKKEYIALGLVGLMLTGCTTLRGGPQNVLDETGTGIRVASEENPLTTRESIIAHYVQLGSGERRKEFRNRVIDHYMGEMDRTYEHYSQRLFSEGLEVALGFDASIIGLASAAALFQDKADELATVISGFAGVQSSINKNLYFDRTLPALIVTMDAQRTEVETEILSRKGQSTSEYSLEGAIRDLRRYQQAGTLMRAVTGVSEIAIESKRLADRARLEVLPFGCVPSEELIDAVQPIADFNLDQAEVLTNFDASEEAKATAWRNLVFLATLMNQRLEEKIAIPVNSIAVDAVPILVRGNSLALRDADEVFCTVTEVEALSAQLSQFNGE